MDVAYIGKVTQIDAINGADKIESLEVVCGKGGKWRGIAKKGLHKIDELVEVYLQDALLPQTERFAFMEKHKYRVKMMRFKGVPSECLIMPNEAFPNEFNPVGETIPNIEKYEKPIPAHLHGVVEGNFPTHLIPKTDELNFQTVPEMVEAIKGKKCYITVKCDGSSATFYKYNNHFGVCSRNLELKEDDNNILWKIANKYNLKDILLEGFAIQCEAIGPGIQGNPMGLKEVDIKAFNVYDINNRKYLDYNDMVTFLENIKVPQVPMAMPVCILNEISDDYLRKLAEGVYDNGKPREGIVIRPIVEERMGKNRYRLSFKVINLLYKEKE